MREFGHFLAIRWLAAGLALTSGACASVSQPRTGSPIAFERFQELGAVTDASRGFPVAFHASPLDKPQEITVDSGLGGTTVRTSQWLTDLARSMNMAMARVGLFDERFKPVSQVLFHYETDSGDTIYDFKDTSLPATGARVAKLSMREMKTRSESDGTNVQIQVQVDMPGFTHVYACEKVAASAWDREAFTCIGEKILGDSVFWKAATFVP